MKHITQAQLNLHKRFEVQMLQIQQLDTWLRLTEDTDSTVSDADRQALLENLMQKSQVLTSQLAEAEFVATEFIRLEAEQERLQRVNQSKTKTLRQLQDTVEQTRTEHRRIHLNVQTLEDQSKRLDQERTALQEQQITLTESLEHKETQRDILQEEIDALKHKTKHLEQNIKGLQQLRDQNLLSVMDLTARLNDVSSGKGEKE